MKTHNIQNKLKPIIIWLNFIGMVSTGQSQKNNLQFQIGGQIMQNYNLAKLTNLNGSYTSTKIIKEKGCISFNQDISVSYFLDGHGVTLGSGFYTTKRQLDIVHTDDIGRQDEYQIILADKNYNVYIMYAYTKKISQSFDFLILIGPMWAKNCDPNNWFFVPVKPSYFSGIGKIGVQYKLSDHLSLELNGIAVRSLTNIVDVSQGTTGSIIPFLVGLDLRVGYQF